LRTRKLDKKHFIDDYLHLQKKLGKQPTCIEFAQHHHQVSTLSNVFGSPGWRNLLLAAGGTPREFAANVSHARVVEDYLSLKEELGRPPTAGEYAEKRHSLGLLLRVFGSCGWNNLLKAAGEKPKHASFFTKAMLIRDYRELKKKLGRQPSRSEYIKECHGLGIIASKFGKPAWPRLLDAAGDSYIIKWGFSAEHLIKDFLDLQKKLGRRPKIPEYSKQCHTIKVLDRVFGKPGWRRLLKALGAKAMPKNILTAEHLIRDYRETAKALGREPTWSQFQQRHHHGWSTLKREFGKPGWSNLQKAARR